MKTGVQSCSGLVAKKIQYTGFKFASEVSDIEVSDIEVN